MQNIVSEETGLIRKRQLASMLSLSPRTIDNLIRKKKIPLVRLSSRCVRFSPERVLAALRKFEIREVGR
jgi:predicted DNA-binding transcriptional regulator AlpA